jgi:hypothetical protein
LDVFYEKGSYLWKASEACPNYHISDVEIEKRMQEFQIRYLSFCSGLEQRYPIHIDKAGAKTHRSVLSLDILKQGARVAPGADMESFKVTDPAVLKPVKKEMQEAMERLGQGMYFTDMNNGNYEIAPSEIDKDKGIVADAEFQSEGNDLILGDSPNDMKAFGLRKRFPRVASGLVFHDKTPQGLLEDTDFVTLEQANLLPYFRAIEEAKKS